MRMQSRAKACNFHIFSLICIYYSISCKQTVYLTQVFVALLLKLEFRAALTNPQHLCLLIGTKFRAAISFRKLARLSVVWRHCRSLLTPLQISLLTLAGFTSTVWPGMLFQDSGMTRPDVVFSPLNSSSHGWSTHNENIHDTYIYYT